jgi:hypothetical protein
VGLEQWPGKRKIKLEEEPISEILVAGTDSETGAEPSDVEDCFEEEEEEEEEEGEQQQQQQQQQASAKVTITNTSQRNHQPNFAAVCVLLASQERAVYKCARCDMGPCVVPCFAEYHTKVNS